ncbi:MAG: O-antigen ligase family protein [Candidatus Aminicenantes bacterium]|nr:O-antigen ligase family protein [Candidatus Aminicenantes bacterium]
MFTGLYNIIDVPEWYTSPLGIFQGMRALLPILALYISLLWIFVGKLKFPSPKTPLGLFFYYSLVGLATSLFSPNVLTSLYWGLLFLATVLVTWVFYMREDSLKSLQIISYVNYIVVIGIFLIIALKVIPLGFGARGQQYYDLPFGLGEMNANGVGRFALVVIIISGIWFFYKKEKIRYAWLGLCLLSVFILMFTQSRTALLGLGVASILFVLIMGFRWYYVLLGPFVALVLWQAGYTDRAGGNINILVNLSGRESTWREAFSLIKQSPFLGWGFHSDRIMLDSAHIHNSYLHATIQSGILGLFFFVLAIASIWFFFFKMNIFKMIRHYEGKDKPTVIGSVLLIGFFSARSLFESTAAFYGVDLLIFLPAIVYVYNWLQVQPQEDEDNPPSETEFVKSRSSSLRPNNFNR